MFGYRWKNSLKFVPKGSQIIIGLLAHTHITRSQCVNWISYAASFAFSRAVDSPMIYPHHRLPSVIPIKVTGNQLGFESNDMIPNINKLVVLGWAVSCGIQTHQVLASWSIWDLTGIHYGFIKWKHFSCYCPFVRGIHLSPVDSPHKGK